MNSNSINKEIFSENLRRYVDQSGKTQKDIACDLNVKESSFNGWCRGEYYPRMDKIDLLANYFHCSKSDLIERRSENYIMGTPIKDVLDTINDSPARKEVFNFILNCSDKDISLLLTMVKTLKGE